MAEPVQERKTFKWGDKEYLVDDLLAMHSAQAENYYNFAQARGNYKGDALTGLREAISSRIEAVKSGSVFGADGSLEGDQVNNVTILSDKKRLAKKGVGTNQDTTEWSKYYLSKLVSQLKPYQKDTSATDWNPEKHGFAAYLAGQGVNAQDVFEQYDIRDPKNPTAARSYTERKELLKGHLTGYQQWLTGKGFDFTKNSSEWDDSTMADLSTLIEGYDAMDNRALSTYLRKLGAGDDYTTAFTSDRWDMSKPASESIEEATAEAERLAAEEAERQRSEYLRQAQDDFLNAYTVTAGSYYKPHDYSTHEFAEGVTPSFMNYYTSLTGNNRNQFGTYIGSDENAWNKAYQGLMTSFKGGEAYNTSTNPEARIVLQRFFENAPNGFTDLGNGTYLINDSLSDTGAIHIYDPKSGFVQKKHISEYASYSPEIKRAYEDLLYKYINTKHGTDYKNRTYHEFKSGGIIKAQLGTAILEPYNVNDQHHERAIAAGNDVQTQIAKDHYMNKKDKSLSNPDAGMTPAAWARVAYAAADLGSAIAAFVPGYGTLTSAILGVGSTIGNFVTDLGDKAVTGKEAWRNLGMNLGMDVMGLIPGGGAASKMGKIVKTLKTTVPLIMAAPGVMHMLQNSPEIAASWRKAFDGSSDKGGEPMTYQDYMNILQVLNLVTGGASIAANKIKSSNVSTTHSNKVAVDVTDAAGKRKAIVLEGDDVARFNEANAKGKAQEFIDDLEGAGTYKVQNTVESQGWKPWGRDADGNLEGRMPFKKRTTDKARTFEVNSENIRKWRGYGPTEVDASGNPKTRDYVTDDGVWVKDRELVTTSGHESTSAYTTRRQKEVDADIKRLVEEARTHADFVTGKKTELDAVNADLTTHTTRKTSVDSDITTKQAELDQVRARYQEITDWLNAGGVTKAKAERAALVKKLAILDGKKKVASRSQKSIIESDIADVKERIRKIDDSIKNNTSEAQKAASAQDTRLSGELSNLQTEATRLQGLIDGLSKKKKKLTKQTTKHSSAYEELKRFQPIEETYHGQTLKFEPSTPISLDALFKQGGQINRNKINKFLNYAKG